MIYANEAHWEHALGVASRHLSKTKETHITKIHRQRDIINEERQTTSVFISSCSFDSKQKSNWNRKRKR